MSASASAATRLPPDEDDLQALYNQVWASFAEEEERERERRGPPVPPPPPSTAKAGLPTNPRDPRASSAQSNSPTVTSPSTGRPPRPLPRPPPAPTPGGHSSAGSGLGIGIGMPQPEPFLRPETDVPRYEASPRARSPGLPSNPRPGGGGNGYVPPPPKPPTNSSSASEPSHSPTASQFQQSSMGMGFSMPVPDISGGGDPGYAAAYGAHPPVRSSSARPSVNGYSNGNGDRAYSPAPGAHPPPRTTSIKASGVMGGGSEGRPSFEDSRYSSGANSDPYASDPALDRNRSTSTTSSADVNRSLSATSAFSYTTGAGGDIRRGGPSSSLATSVDFERSSSYMAQSPNAYNHQNQNQNQGQEAQRPELNQKPSFALSDTMRSVNNASAGPSYPHASSQSHSQTPSPVAAVPDRERERERERRMNDLDLLMSAKETAEYIAGGEGGEVGPDGEPFEEYDDDYFSDEEEDETRFINFALLSHIAVRLRDKVPRGTHVKGSIPYPKAFTGKDIVSTIQSHIQRELLVNQGISTSDRRAALQLARSLQSQLFFYEVEWGGRVLQDGVEDVYMFLDDQEGAGSNEQPQQREELPTGVFTLLTSCYSAKCRTNTEDSGPCYAYGCPRRKETSILQPAAVAAELPVEQKEEWSLTVQPEVLQSLPDSEINRQTIIHKIISKELQYVQDLDLVETLFIRPLRTANPPVIASHKVDDFIEEVFNNILDLRECNRRLLEMLYVRQREQAPVIQRIGDIFLAAATEFRLAYPIYVGHLPLSEKRMKDELEHNADFRLFTEQCARDPAARRLDLKHFLTRPSEHLQKYPVLLDAIFKETVEGNPDADYLQEAIQAIKNLQTVAQLWTFQSAMGKGPTSKFEWFDLAPENVQNSLSKQEKKRQSIIFEVIKGEMSYVKDLENIENIYVTPLRTADPPIIAPFRLDSFIQDVFHNYKELYHWHSKLLERMQELQREQHPTIVSITAPVLDAFLNFRDAYLEYVPNYPIAAYRVEDEMGNNSAFKAFVDQCIRHPDAHRLDMKSFINRPIPRLLRYELLLKGILEETPSGSEDREEIPHLLDVIKSLGKETEPGVASAKQKVELWRYNSNLVFKSGEFVDMDLLDESRSLIHVGKLLRQPESGFEWSGWSELCVILFDNYLVMTKPKDKDGLTKYNVVKRPIPLDLLTLSSFSDPPTQRSAGILRGLRGGEKTTTEASPGMSGGPESAGDVRAVYPCTIYHNGRMGGLYTLYAETAQVRTEWKTKLEEAIGLRKVVQESNKVFEIETLSAETFLVPAISMGAASPAYSNESSFTGKVTCSVPFDTADGRSLMAIGCAEGVWIGFRHDARSLRRVLHLKMVSQCAMLEDFGIFLVLADKSLFAYHIEALVPSSMQSVHSSQTPQKLSGTKDVHFFSVGSLNGRTLVIYMKKKGLDSVFRVLEPVIGAINEKSRAPVSIGSRLGLRSQRSEWFRIYREFFLPSEAYDLVFLKARIAILCTKGFEIMDLTDFKSVTIPQRDDPRVEKLAKRAESCKPIGMVRSNEDEFLLCYDEFGLYVDRHGDPSRKIFTIEWEGTAERVAWHPPYVLLFDSRFIEVRHVETGRLAQIIPGNDVRCIWDGRGASIPPASTPGPGGWQDGGGNQEARVHAVMNAPETNVTGGRSRAVAQHIFELIPTVPLFLPGAISSPTQSAYFPQSNSPPRSPRMNSSGSYAPSVSTYNPGNTWR